MTAHSPTAAPDTPAASGIPEAFRVFDPVEVKSLLKSLMDRNVTINLNGSDGSAYATTLWTVDVERGVLAFSADLMAPDVHRVVEADEAMAVGYLDQVKVQFEVVNRMLVHGHQSSVLQALLPRELFRFQRRHAFRVRTLERNAPTARFRHPSIPDMALELRVLDVSAHGCALLMPADMPMFEPGVNINDCVIELDIGTAIRGTLVVHHVTSIQSQSRGMRLGCELLQLDADALCSLQRYIDLTQKRRRMLSLD